MPWDLDDEYTPLLMGYDIEIQSYGFSGLSPNRVRSLDVSHEIWSAYCTCRQCIEGLISPRVCRELVGKIDKTFNLKTS